MNFCIDCNNIAVRGLAGRVTRAQVAASNCNAVWEPATFDPVTGINLTPAKIFQCAIQRAQHPECPLFDLAPNNDLRARMTT